MVWLRTICVGLLCNAMGICCAAQTMDDARRIQAGVLGVDSHNDTAQRVLIERSI